MAIMGPSGSGKSTLLNLIGGLDLPTSGSVVVGGTDLGTLDETARSRLRRSEVAYVFQAFHLLPTLTCAENVAMPLHLQGRSRQDADARVARVLSDVGLAARARHLPDELSGGERQRTAIARALAAEPRVLLVDEPTGSLDTASSDRVLTTLFEVSRARGVALVMVTHDRTAAAGCERLIELRDGRVERDTADPRP
jgi:putative ABC transport system ATP-binding protein